MSKKDKQEIPSSAESVTPPVEQTEVSPAVQTDALYESEAYGDPQPDEGIKTTVMKPVGMGGPVPIIAPKHNTVQLQPIVVPLAVVPYMSQDSEVLRTDGRMANRASAEGTDFDVSAAVQAEKDKQKKHKAVQTRIFSLVTFLAACLIAVVFILAYYKPVYGKVDFSDCDVIGAIVMLANGLRPEPLAPAVTLIVGAASVAVVWLVSLFGMIFGKYPRKTLLLFAFIAVAVFAAEIIYDVVKKTFVAGESAGWFIMLGLGGLEFVLSIIFLIASIRRVDKDEAALARVEREI